MEAQMTRSAQSLLDIEIHSWDHGACIALCSPLPCAPLAQPRHSRARFNPSLIPLFDAGSTLSRYRDAMNPARKHTFGGWTTFFQQLKSTSVKV